MSEPKFEEVDVPQGTFLAWGKPGQVATIDVISYAPTGGTDFNEQPCPQLVGTLTADADNYRDKGTAKEVLKAGTVVTVNAGQANLRRVLLTADPSPGDIIRLTFVETTPGAKGEIKLFKAEMARGAGTGRPVAQEAGPANKVDDPDEEF